MMAHEGKALCAVFALALVLPAFVRDEYVLHLMVMACFYVILASSLNVVVGYLGELSLGHTAFLGIGAYSSALLSSRLGLPTGWTLLAAGACAALGGILVGYLTLRLEGPFFVIVTLSFAEVLRIVATNWIGLTNGPMGISGVAPPVFAFGGLGGVAVKGKVGFFYLALALAAVTLFVIHRFVHSNLGRAAVALRENRHVAQSVGIDPFFHALAAFVLGAFFAGLAGAFYVHYITFVGPEIFGFSFMVSMLIMVLIGGKGTLIGPILGAIVVTLLEEYLRAAQEIRLSIFGITVALIVLFLPNGLVGLPAFIGARWRRMRAGAVGMARR
jgi:branched-chain amino acid transport system permease protein